MQAQRERDLAGCILMLGELLQMLMFLQKVSYGEPG